MHLIQIDTRILEAWTPGFPAGSGSSAYNFVHYFMKTDTEILELRTRCF